MARRSYRRGIALSQKRVSFNCRKRSVPLFPGGATLIEETLPCQRKQPSTISSHKNTIRMLRVTTVKQLSTMRAGTTKKRPIMRTPQGDMRFTLGITRTKLPRLTWKSTARSSRLKICFGGRLSWRPHSFRSPKSRCAALSAGTIDPLGVPPLSAPRSTGDASRPRRLGKRHQRLVQGKDKAQSRSNPLH